MTYHILLKLCENQVHVQLETFCWNVFLGEKVDAPAARNEQTDDIEQDTAEKSCRKMEKESNGKLYLNILNYLVTFKFTCNSCKNVVCFAINASFFSHVQSTVRINTLTPLATVVKSRIPTPKLLPLTRL